MKTTLEYIVVFITTKDADEARKIAHGLLERRLAACINIVPEVSSHFWWQDKLESARESLIVAKTKYSLLDGITRLVKEIHSYEVPEIIALPVIGGSRDYLDWLDHEVT